MAPNDGVRRYLDAGMALTQITRARAEELVRELVAAGEVERNRAQDWVEDLVKRSRETSEAFVTTISTEVRRQLTDLGITSLDEIARRVAEILGDLPTAARSAGARTTGAARQAATSTVAAAKKTGARQVAAVRKSGAKKAAPAKKAPAKKAPARKAPAKKAAG